MNRKSIVWFAVIVAALIFVFVGGGAWLWRMLLEMHGIHQR
jgi:hypothetical protein